MCIKYIILNSIKSLPATPVFPSVPFPPSMASALGLHHRQGIHECFAQRSLDIIRKAGLDNEDFRKLLKCD